jgi:diguanylate cyclase (GGDEF)-like protein
VSLTSVDYEYLLKVTRDILDFKELGCQISFALGKAKAVSQADDVSLLLFRPNDLNLDITCFDLTGQESVVMPSTALVEAFKSAFTRKDRTAFFLRQVALRKNGRIFDLTLNLPFQLSEDLYGGIILGDLIGRPNLQLMTCFTEQVAACMEKTILIRRLERQIDYLSNYDDLLTKLPNQRLFRQELNSAVNQSVDCNKLAILFIDLDDVKQVNQSLGQSAGDLLLFSVAQRLLDFAKGEKNAVMLARIGGDEFAMLLNDLPDYERARSVAIRMLAEIKRPFNLDGISCFVTASIGIGRFPYDDQIAENIMLCANKAMYLAKKQGKDRCSFYG